MGIHVYLTRASSEEDCTCPRCNHQHRRVAVEDVYDAGITHNLGLMAEAAGVYLCLWFARETGVTKAAQLIDPLRQGIAVMRADPVHFRTFDSPNGWGSYENFLPWLEKLLAACEEHPDADVHVSV